MPAGMDEFTRIFGQDDIRMLVDLLKLAVVGRCSERAREAVATLGRGRGEWPTCCWSSVSPTVAGPLPSQWSRSPSIHTLTMPHSLGMSEFPEQRLSGWSWTASVPQRGDTIP